MTWIETVLLLLGGAAVLAVLGPQRKHININPPPTYAKPPPPPPPPPVHNHQRKQEDTMDKGVFGKYMLSKANGNHLDPAAIDGPDGSNAEFGVSTQTND